MFDFPLSDSVHLVPKSHIFVATASLLGRRMCYSIISKSVNRKLKESANLHEVESSSPRQVDEISVGFGRILIQNGCCVYYA